MVFYFSNKSLENFLHTLREKETESTSALTMMTRMKMMMLIMEVVVVPLLRKSAYSDSLWSFERQKHQNLLQ